MTPQYRAQPDSPHGRTGLQAGWLEDRSEDVSRGAAIAAQSQQDTAALPPSRPFAVGRAGFDYFPIRSIQLSRRPRRSRIAAGWPDRARHWGSRDNPGEPFHGVDRGDGGETHGAGDCLWRRLQRRAAAPRCGSLTAPFILSSGQAVRRTTVKALQLSGIQRQQSARCAPRLSRSPQPPPKSRCRPPSRPRHQPPPKPRHRPCRRRGRPPKEPRPRAHSQPSRSLCCSPAVMRSCRRAISPRLGFF
jgi:hypothetical protein